MTCEVKNTQFDMAMELLIDNGPDGMADAISRLMNTAMQIERSRYLRGTNTRRAWLHIFTCQRYHPTANENQKRSRKDFDFTDKMLLYPGDASKFAVFLLLSLI